MEKNKPSQAYISGEMAAYGGREIYSILFQLWKKGDCSILVSKKRDTGYFCEVKIKTTNEEVYNFWKWLTRALVYQGFNFKIQRDFIKEFSKIEPQDVGLGSILNDGLEVVS